MAFGKSTFGKVLFGELSTETIVSPAIDDINTNETILDGEVNVTFATSNFTNEITHVRLESGDGVIVGSDVNSTSGAGDFDLAAVTSVGFDAEPGCPFTSASWAVNAIVGDGIDESSLTVTYNPASGYAVTEVTNVNNTIGTFSQGFTGDVANTAQVLYSTANNLTISSGGATTAITGITQANPAVVSVVNTYSGGETISIKDIVGMVELNGGNYKVSNPTGTTIELQDLDGNDVDSSGYTAYTSGGTAGEAGGVITTDQTSGTFDIWFFDPVGFSWERFNVSANSPSAGSDTISATVIPATNNSYVNLSGTLASSGDRITAIPDLVAGDQLRYQSILYDGATPTSYAVTVFIDGTYSITGGPIPSGTYTFEVAAWDDSDDTWSAGVNQTVVIQAGQTGSGTLVSQESVLTVDADVIVKAEPVTLTAAAASLSATGETTTNAQPVDLQAQPGAIAAQGVKEVKGTATLDAQPAQIDSTGEAILDGDGILVSQPAGVAGLAYKTVKSDPSSLESQESSLDTTGKKTVKAQPVSLDAQPAILSGSAETVIQGFAAFSASSAFLDADGSKTIKGSVVLDSDIADLDADGERTVVGTGDLQVEPAGFLGVGSGVVTGTGDLQSQNAVLTVVAGKATVGTGDLQSQEAEVDGQASRTIKGTSDLQSQPAEIDGASIRIVSGTATLNSGIATIQSSSVRIILGTANFTAQAAEISAFELDNDVVFPKNRTAYPGRPICLHNGPA